MDRSEHSAGRGDVGIEPDGREGDSVEDIAGGDGHVSRNGKGQDALYAIVRNATAVLREAMRTPSSMRRKQA